MHSSTRLQLRKRSNSRRVHRFCFLRISTSKVRAPFSLLLVDACQIDSHIISVLAGGLVNGSRGVIVDWISAEEVPDEAAFGPIVQNGGPKKSGGAGRVGTEEWRQKAAEDFMDQQEKVFYPLVFFATGQEGQSPYSPSFPDPISVDDSASSLCPFSGIVIIRPHSWCIDFDKNNTVARTQIPLQLAW